MSIITHPDDLDLANEVTQLRRQLAKLLRQLKQRTDAAADYTIDEWCAKRRVSHAGYYKLRKEGRAPRAIENGGLVRITPEADREWEARFTPADLTAFTTSTEES